MLILHTANHLVKKANVFVFKISHSYIYLFGIQMHATKDNYVFFVNCMYFDKNRMVSQAAHIIKK